LTDLVAVTVAVVGVVVGLWTFYGLVQLIDWLEKNTRGEISESS
jgi:hypothetical protein